MENRVIRLLKADEIECRAATVNEKGVSLLLYKDARVDQRILDESFGIFGWKRSHQCIDGSLYCTVEIFDRETSTWVAKQDVGAAALSEKEKSQASDSFKRACFNWGIGRELYTSPFIWITADRASIQKRNNRYVCNSHFSVDTISYNEDREIVGLSISDEKGQIVFEWKSKGAMQGGQELHGTDFIAGWQMEFLKKELERTGVELKAVQDRYQIEKPEQMSKEIYKKVMAALAKTKSAEAA